MKLENYQSQVRLYEPWQPARGVEVNLARVIALLQGDPALGRYVAQYPAPSESETEKRLWVKAMLTLRPAGQPSETLFEAVDALLSQEVSLREVQDARQLPLSVRQEEGRLGVSLWQGDITTLKVDAIVNAANSQMLGCFQPFHACIDNAIHSIAGPRLREDCETIVSLQGGDEATGMAKITRGYNLPAPFVVHTVGPIIDRGRALTQDDRQALADCYHACLSLADGSGLIKSIAFCGISTGVFGFPKREAAEVAVSTVLPWLSQAKNIEQVVFNTFDEESTRLYARELSLWD